MGGKLKKMRRLVHISTAGSKNVYTVVVVVAVGMWARCRGKKG